MTLYVTLFLCVICQAGKLLAIYAETRSEWILAVLAAFSLNMVVSTLYTNLGEVAVAHGMNETEVRQSLLFTRL